jgi:hypothetical protein
MITITTPWCSTNDPNWRAAKKAAKAIGLEFGNGIIASIDLETFHRSVTTDAAEALGIPVEALDATRKSHTDTMTRVATSLLLDEVDSIKNPPEKS